MMKTKQMTLMRALCLMIALLVVDAGVVSGAPLLGTDDFQNGDNGWTYYTPDYNPPASGGVVSDGHGNSYYQLYFGPISPPGEQIGTIYNSTHPGDYSDTDLTFNFWSAPAPPTVALSVFFVGNGTTWNHSFVVPASQWTSVAMNFSPDSGWTSADGIDFLSDVTQITVIGIEVNHLNANGSDFTYGLDNWTTSVLVPEPESVALLVVALLSLAITFRGNIRPCLAKIPFCDRFTPNR